MIDILTKSKFFNSILNNWETILITFIVLFVVLYYVQTIILKKDKGMAIVHSFLVGCLISL